MINDIVIFSTADWNTKPWTNKQHTAKTLAERGYRVLYVDSTGIRSPGANKADLNRMLQRLLAGFSGAKKVSQNIYRYSPLVIPFRYGKWIDALNRILLTVAMRMQLRKLGFKDVLVWVYNPDVANIIRNINAKLSIYHCVDDLSAIPGISSTMIRDKENQLANLVSLVFTTNINLHKRWCRILPDSAFYQPNVANYDHFKRARNSIDTAREMDEIPYPRIGYIGTLSDFKVDFHLVMTVAINRPDWHWVIIGGEREGQCLQVLEDLKTLRNVHMLGYKEYDVLPELMAGMDIATLPILDNSYTRSMFPMKFFEYLGAGLPVISTPLPALHGYQKAYRMVNNADEFIVAVEKILGGNIPDRAYCDLLARKHTWDQRLDTMLRHIERKGE